LFQEIIDILVNAASFKQIGASHVTRVPISASQEAGPDSVGFSPGFGLQPRLTDGKRLLLLHMYM